MADTFKDKRVVVTGANGFIGAHLVSKLENEGAEVFALVRKHSDLSRLTQLDSRAKRVIVDLLDYKTVISKLGTIQANYVFHTAVGRSQDDWRSTLELNGAATLNLLHAAASASLENFIHCGSSLEYGDIDVPFSEHDAIKPSSLFGASKAAATLQLQQLALSRHLPVIILRIFHVYGVLESRHRLVPTAIRNSLMNRAITLTEPGYCHDFVFVEDVVKACLMAATGHDLSGRIFNIGSGIPVSNEKVVSRIGTLTGKPVKVKKDVFPAREWDKTNWYADITRAQTELGWQAETSLQEGLQKCIAWYIQNEH